MTRRRRELIELSLVQHDPEKIDGLYAAAIADAERRAAAGSGAPGFAADPTLVQTHWWPEPADE